MRRCALPLLASAAALLVALPVAADAVPSLDLRGFHAPTDPGSGLSVQPAETPATGEWNAGLFTSYAYRPITLRQAPGNAVLLDVITHQVSSDLVLGVGLWRRIHVGLDLPVVLYQTGATPTAAAVASVGSYQIPRQAFGDLGLDARLTLVRPTGGSLGGFALALHERVSIPTGDTSSFMGEGVAGSETRVLAEYHVSAVGIHAAAGFRARGHSEALACGTTTSDCPTRFGNEIPFGLGVSVLPQKLGLDDEGRMTWFLEMNGHLPAGPIAPFKSTPASSLQVDAAIRVALGHDVSLLAAVQAGFLGLGDAPVRGVVAISWAPRSHDRDGDGIPDEKDHCPDLPEDFDGFQDHDGCPELDNDGDGIPDKVDLCPNEPEDVDGYQDADGCPDPDNDGDRIPDVEDACPNDPGPPDPDPKKNGCPLRDRDGGSPETRETIDDGGDPHAPALSGW